MRKKIFGLALAVSLAVSMPLAAQAETMQGDPDWAVTFMEGNKMESNFGVSDLDDMIYGMQPGDNVIIEMALKNENSATTDWYMTNKVLRSLEETTENEGASGGAYTYRLLYVDKDGQENSLFDSDTVGGEGESGAGEGLHQATDATKEYMYLDTLAKGQGGHITLEVALDGETQGNDYQDTLADLQMNFAVELSSERQQNTPTPRPTTPPRGGTPAPVRPTTETLHDLGTPTAMVQTGDDTKMDGYILAACISGGVLLILSIYGQAVRRKKRGEGDGR